MIVTTGSLSNKIEMRRFGPWTQMSLHSDLHPPLPPQSYTVSHKNNFGPNFGAAANPSIEFSTMDLNLKKHALA